MKLQELQKKFEEVLERLHKSKELNVELMSQAATYRANWINEARRVQALELFGVDDAPCLSQARWFSPSPDRSYCKYLDYLDALERSLGPTSFSSRTWCPFLPGR